MSILAAFFTVLLNTFPGTFEGHQKEAPAVENCLDAGAEILVTAQQLRKKPPSYKFLVTNLTDSPLMVVVIGNGRGHALQAFAYNVPTHIGSPPGWKGIKVVPEESIYMHYFWSAEDESKGILPGQSSSDFQLDLPAMPSLKPQIGSEGREVKQVDFRDLPFNVLLSDSRSYCGTIRVDPLGK